MTAAQFSQECDGIAEAQRRADEQIAEFNALAAKSNHDAVIELHKEVGRLRVEIAKLRRGEFICRHCGLRKDAEKVHAEF